MACLAPGLWKNQGAWTKDILGKMDSWMRIDWLKIVHRSVYTGCAYTPVLCRMFCRQLARRTSEHPLFWLWSWWSPTSDMVLQVWRGHWTADVQQVSLAVSQDYLSTRRQLSVQWPRPDQLGLRQYQALTASLCSSTGEGLYNVLLFLCHKQTQSVSVTVHCWKFNSTSCSLKACFSNIKSTRPSTNWVSNFSQISRSSQLWRPVEV